jgi:2-polyprenyl-6-methoxyphenol hydroxylase-like FAD-dependent oxidoreductase
MDVSIVGAGPTGLFSAIALARRGHRVSVVDRDPGPAADGSWDRKGVMQFHHPHGLRQQVADCLDAEMPDVKEALLAAGAGQTILPAEGGRPEIRVGLRCRRSTFERVLRAAAVAQPGVTFVRGHADGVLPAGGRVAGLLVDGEEMPADLVLNASGRNGKLGAGLRAPEVGADCGLAYVSRHYELLSGAEPGPQNNPIGRMQRWPGYLCAVFLGDNDTFCLLVVRLRTDRALADLRHEAAFDAAVSSVPGFSEWIDPGRSRPITGVLPGGHLRNTYQGQADEQGRIALPGLIHVGDAVCTTNPTAGRGIATSLMQSSRLLALLDADDDLASVATAFDEWCTERIRPWFDDHIAWDADEQRQWAGEDVDLTRPLTSGHITAAAEADPSLMRVIGPFFAMDAMPASLAAIEPRVREIYARGWRPAIPPGPSRDDLVELIAPLTAAAR